jgi:phosphohistidine phosphatase
LVHDYVRDRGVAPELVICSTSRRTRETVEAVAPPGELVLEPRIYSASSEELLLRVRALDPNLREVMIVGHNPALQMLILKLAGGRRYSDDLAAIRTKFPAGALATLAFEGDWSTLAPAEAELVGYVHPKALQYQ